MGRQIIRRKHLALGITGAMFVVGISSTAQADLTLNFQPVDPANRVSSIANLDCRTPNLGGCRRGGSLSDPDKSPFFQEVVQEPDGQYYHVIVGDPTSDFAVEYYIKTVGGSNGWFSSAPYNASGGAMFNGGQDTFPNSTITASPLSKGDPGGNFFSGSGNGSGNPKRVLFRQNIVDSELQQEVTKASFLNKPKITQAVVNSELNSEFEFDMSNSSYDDMNTTGIMAANRTVVIDSNTGAPMFEFDAATDSQVSNVTGGEYIYNTGTFFDGSFGNYTYSEGGFDVYQVDWSLYSNPSNIPSP